MTSGAYITSKPGAFSEQYLEAVLLIGKLDIELTERCNNNCIHCYINRPSDDSDARSREMSTDRVISILNEAASLGCLTVRYSGGEPLLRKDFIDIYLATRRLGLSVLLFTNATLLTQELVGVMQQVPPLEPVEVTLYGMTQESYEAVTRTPGSFSKAMDGILLLKQNAIPFIVKWVNLPFNTHEQSEFEAFARDIPWIKQAPRAAHISLNLRARRDDPAKNQVIKGLRGTPESIVAAEVRNLDVYHKDKKYYCAHFVHTHPGKALFSCGAGKGGCIDAYGMHQPCMLLRHPSTTCDTAKCSLSDTLTNFFPSVIKLQAQNSEFLNRCAKCFIRQLCEQCPAKSWMEHGTLDTPVEYECRLAHEHARAMGLLTGNEYAPEVKDGVSRIQAYIESNITAN